MAGSNPSADLKELQSNKINIRNICILAHVDHGKTTLADSLIASNGIISRRQAGKVRYMDSRKDEQFRGITMKSSAIALRYTEDGEENLINLIDSPGHVDFSSEVSTAVWLCDGALVVVDVVEGVCPQTKVVLEQAWKEGVKPCLVLNKLDRLITELSKSPTEAYYHIRHVLEQVNAVTGTLWTREVMQQASRTIGTTDHVGALEDVVYDWSVPGLGGDDDEEDDSSVYFSPEFGNVIFTSAKEGWGFSIEDFARIYSSKLGMKADVLRRTLWGDFYLNTKTKRIHGGAFNKGKKPLFVQFILENIWAVYDSVLISAHRDKEKIKKITQALGLKMTPREFSHIDRNVQLSAIFTQWLPLADVVLKMVSAHLPSPLGLSEERVERIMTGNSNQRFDSFSSETQKLKTNIMSCNDAPDSPTIVFVSKLFPVDSQTLPKNRGKSLTREELLAMREDVKERVLSKFTEGSEVPEQESSNAIETDGSEATPTSTTVFLGFARVFSGCIKRGQELYVLHPRYDPRDPGESPELRVVRFTVQDLYLLMGREVVEVESVSAGNVLGIGGLHEHVLKCVTLSSTLSCPALRSSHFTASPIVHVAVEPVHLSDMPQLMKGMKLLNQADPCVEVTIQETGQHVLSTAGEVHLQRCLDDLRDTFACVPLDVSEPIVPFRETIVPRPKVDMVNEAITSENEIKRVTNPLLKTEGDSREGTIIVSTANKLCSLKILATPLPGDVIKLLETNSDLLKLLLGSQHINRVEMKDETISKLKELRSNLENAFYSSGWKWKGVAENIMAFGPRSIGPNILVNRVKGYDRPSVWAGLDTPTKDTVNDLREYDNSIFSGFQLATLSGPLCEEPMHGVCYSLMEWTVTNGQTDKMDDTETTSANDVRSDSYGPFSGQLISAMKEGCRKAFLLQSSRLMAAMYSCDIVATASILGQVYAVIGRRGGRVISDEMIEGSEMFIIYSLIPVAESFGFAEEIRKKTGGLAMPQLIFSHWEVIPSDPFWIPSTEEELAHFGDKADNESIARAYMNSVRRRKGLSVEEKLVEHAEKQRTLKKNK